MHWQHGRRWRRRHHARRLPRIGRLTYRPLGITRREWCKRVCGESIGRKAAVLLGEGSDGRQ